MRRKHQTKPGSAEQTVRDIRRATRKQYSAEEKIRIVLEGLRGEDGIAELCRILAEIRNGGFVDPGNVTVDALRLHRAEQAELMLSLGTGWNEDGLVCLKGAGDPINPNTLTSGFASFMENIDLPKIRFHDLRHTHAAHLLKAGVHPKVAQERLGHATIAVTLDLYSHVMPGMQEDAAMRVDRALRTALGKRPQQGI